ncbi:MAG: hypothetical protein CL815_03060, partial [Coraliomargarita sp.]|nr:hypothetical protein [Coraliomargarita sp.]
SSLDSAEEFASGSFVFVEKGTQAGQGYVLAEVASDFALGTSSISYSQFTLDASALGDVSAGSVAASGLNVGGAASFEDISVMGPATMSNGLSVSGTATMSNGLSVSGGILDADTVEASRLYVNGPYGSTSLDGYYNEITGDRLTLFHPMGTIIEGDVSVSGIVTANAFELRSDYRFKDNIKTITGAVDKVKQLRGVEYTLKSNGKDSVGVIAQEVEEVYPQLVSTSDESLGVKDAKSVNYSSLIGVLIEAVKEQQSQIEALKTQVNELQKDNTNTENTSTNLVVLGANN